MTFARSLLGDRASRQLQSGDPRVLETVLDEISPRVQRFLSRRYQGTLRPGEIEDVLMIALMRLWQRRAQFDPAKGSLAAWYSRIAEHVAADTARLAWCRVRRREKQIDPVDTERAVTTAAGPMPPEGTEVEELLSHLPEKWRKVLLVDIGDHSGGAASELLGMAPSTIREYRRRARAKIQEMLSVERMEP